MNPKIIAVIDNINMGLGHDGLNLIAKKFGIHFDKLNPGELVLFLNTAKDKLKVMGMGHKTLGYIKMPDRTKIPLDAIQWLPQTFSPGGAINIEAALFESIKISLNKKTKRQKAYTL